MAEQKSDDSRYESRYGGGYITPAQFIAEVMCERLAKKNKKDLPVKFWNLPTWKKPFMLQVLAANSFLKLYAPRAILAGLKRAPNAFSLRANFLNDIFQEEQMKVNELEKRKQETVEVVPSPAKPTVVEKPREAFAPKNTISKLRDL